MTTTKALYIAAAIIPFGCVMLAAIGILHVVMVGLRERRLRQQAQAKMAVPRDLRFRASTSGSH